MNNLPEKVNVYIHYLILSHLSQASFGPAISMSLALGKWETTNIKQTTRLLALKHVLFRLESQQNSNGYYLPTWFRTELISHTS